MRVRIKQHPFEPDMWGVEVKYWWSGWTHKKYFISDQAQWRALEAAKRLIDPMIIEVGKDEDEDVKWFI